MSAMAIGAIAGVVCCFMVFHQVRNQAVGMGIGWALAVIMIARSALPGRQDDGPPCLI
jgi:hypothetical protein